jgi:Xaa-Pro dipeptidase
MPQPTPDAAAEPADARAFPREEFAGRRERLQERLAAEGIAALVLTSEDNVVYLTGFNSPTWVNLARPRYCVVPAVGELVFIVPSTNVAAARRLTWIEDVRSWVSPAPADDGLSLVADAVRGISDAGTVGLEIGPQSRIGIPVGDFLTLCEKLGPRRTVDGDAVLREVRKIKTGAEVACIRQAAEAASRAFLRLPRALAASADEISAVRSLRELLLSEDMADVPYVVAESAYGGYPSLQMAPTRHELRKGTILGIDVGCRSNGYFSDFNRNFVFGTAPDIALRADEALRRALDASIAAAVVGATAGDVWRVMAASLDQSIAGLPARRAASGRMGHGIGLRLTEPPSIHPDDRTSLVPGMVLAIEPSVVYELDTHMGTVERMLIHEENIVVTEAGPVLLSQRADGLCHVG